MVAKPFRGLLADRDETPFDTIWALDGPEAASSRTSRVRRIQWPGTTRSNPQRSGARIEIGLFVKCYWYPRWRDRLRAALRNTFLGPSRAAREWHHLRILHASGLSPLRPVGYGEQRHAGFLRRAFLITEALPGGQTVTRMLETMDAPARMVLLTGLAQWAARLHQAGFLHGGLRLRNVIYLGSGSFAAIDPPKGRWHRHSIHGRRQARADWQAVAADLEGRITSAETRRVIGAYLGVDGPAASRRREWRRITKAVGPCAVPSTNRYRARR